MHHAAPVRSAARYRYARIVAHFLLALTGIASAHAQSASPPDAILINGKVVVYDAPPAQALALRDGKISAIGNTATMRALAGPETRIIQLGGRTVIPGLIDSHIHAIRAGISYTSEVHWSDVRTLKQALERLRSAAKTTPKGSWLVVAGGWSERQFGEDRRPTQAEISAAAPHHHVYIQKFYNSVLLDPAGAAALGIADNSAWSKRLTLERDANGRPSGWLAGDNRAISDLFNLLPRPDYAQKLAGTRAFFRTLNSMGVTGVLDPGGYNIEEDDYQPLFQLWRENALTLRVRYSLSAPRRDHELEDFKRLTQQRPMGSGDAWLRFNGIGENVTWGHYNNDQPDAAQKARLETVLRWAASQNMTATFHWHNDRPAHHLLDVVARVHADTPVAALRWSVAHLNDASPETLQRLRSLGMGWLVQNAFYFRGEAFLGQRGAEAARSAPPLVSALRLQLPVGGGTDAHRVMTPNPFVALQWMLDGKTVSGIAMRSAAETPTRLEALRLYTQGSAWFSFEENSRGALAVGQLADLAVLNRDYLGAPLNQIGGITSVLTMVGGRIVYAVGPYAALEEKQR
jgi:predicted amidohydrolase YtcJ